MAGGSKATSWGIVALLSGAALLLMKSSSSGSGDSLVGGGLAAAIVAGSQDSKMVQLAQAIATAEGSAPSANNPGSIALGNQGNGVLNSAGVTIFATIDAGVAALFHELNLVFTGRSAYMNTNMTIQEFAAKYTGGDAAASWAANVARALGVTTDTTLADWYNS